MYIIKYIKEYFTKWVDIPKQIKAERLLKPVYDLIEVGRVKAANRLSDAGKTVSLDAIPGGICPGQISNKKKGHFR